MAYAAVASLLQTLDYLMKFPCMIYEIKKIQGRKFLTALQEFPSLSSRLIFLGKKIRGGEVPEDVQEYSILSSRLHRLIAQAEPLAYTAEDFLGAVGLSDPEMKMFFISETPKLVEEEPLILRELQDLDQDLNRFVDLYVNDITFQLLNDQKTPPEEAKKLVMASRSIIEDTTFFCQVCTETTLVHQLLRFLLTNLDHLQKASPEEAKKLVMADRRIIKQLTLFCQVSTEASLLRLLLQFLLTSLDDLQNTSPEEANKLVMADRTTIKDFNFFRQYYTETTLFRHDLRSLPPTNLDDSSKVWLDFLRQFLPIKLDDSLTVCHDHFCHLLRFMPTNFNDLHDLRLKIIRHDFDRAREAVEIIMVKSQIESAMTSFAETLFRINPRARALGTNAFEEEIKNLFYRNKNICSPLIREIRAIYLPLFDPNGIYSSKVLKTIRDKVQSKAIWGKTRHMNHEMLNLESSTISLRDSKEETVVGFDDEDPSILEKLTGRPSGLEIVTIVGMGGIGKTTLAKKLFNHPYIIFHFDCRAWIKLSHDYQLRDLLLGLLSSIDQRSDKLMEKSNCQLAADLYRRLKGKRYLIVMDDMWSIDAWNEVRRCFPDDKIGSRILVTSRFTKLASYVSPRPPHFMNLLNTEKSWELLEKLVFGNACCSPELLEVGKQIAKRCHGLPLAIVVIAGILSGNIKALDFWKRIAQNLSSMMLTDPEQCLDILALSYIYLPHHLRACFLYMGAFPEDCDIAAVKLINLWVAEGFIFSDNPKNLEQIAEDYLQDLISRNLVLVEKRSIGGKVKSCRLHDFIRELCLREAQKENFMKVIQRGSSRKLSASMLNLRRLSLHLDPQSNDDELPILQLTSSFLCFTLGSDIVPDILFIQLEFKLLRVLDIYFWHFECFPKQVLKLIHLRYLALNVTFELPATISQLRNLQTFVIQGPWSSGEYSNCSKLLLEYWNMPSLRHVLTSVASQLWNPPAVQGDVPWPFTSEYLQTLSTIRFSSCTKEVFTTMPCLKRLRICETKDDYITDRSCCLLNNLIWLSELEMLKCCFYKQNRKARHLVCMYSFPSTLRQLSISWSYLPWEDLTSIAMLPNLQVLKLKHYAFQGPKWLPIKEGFRSLKHLLIENTNLVHWVARVNQFPCLQNLILKSCKHLEEIPFSVEEIGSLQRIEVHYCSEPMEILAKEIQEQVDGVDAVIGSDRAPDPAPRTL